VAQEREPTSVSELLDRIGRAASRQEQVSMNAILDEVGHRSFGPMLLFAGLVMLAPVIGDIPSVPTLMGIIVVLTAGQLLFRHRYIWLPRWMLKRSVSESKVHKTLKWLNPVAGFLDRWTRPRLSSLVRNGGRMLIAAACVAIGLTTPAMEVVPFVANVAGVAIAVFGLALIVHDGLIALLALGFTAATYAVLVWQLI